MKQVHDRPVQTEDVSEDDKAKASQASDKFVDLFRRIVAENHKEKLTNG